jgi:hypothetical protein
MQMLCMHALNKCWQIEQGYRLVSDERQIQDYVTLKYICVWFCNSSKEREEQGVPGATHRQLTKRPKANPSQYLTRSTGSGKTRHGLSTTWRMKSRKEREAQVHQTDSLQILIQQLTIWAIVFSHQSAGFPCAYVRAPHSTTVRVCKVSGTHMHNEWC